MPSTCDSNGCDPGLYRSKDELHSYMENDPVKTTEQTILKEKIAGEKEIEKIKDTIKAEIKAALQFAEESDFPPAEELYTDNYLQKDYPFIKE